MWRKYRTVVVASPPLSSPLKSGETNALPEVTLREVRCGPYPPEARAIKLYAPEPGAEWHGDTAVADFEMNWRSGLKFLLGVKAGRNIEVSNKIAGLRVCTILV